MQVQGYDIDVVVQGYPGKSVCHGGLGWSTIVLLRGNGKVALVDVGSFNIRVPLVERLKHRGLTPKDVTDLLLTHAHHDHCINWTLFSHARIVLGKQEMEWASKVQWGIGPVPELYVEKLQTWNTLHTADEGEEVLPSITAHTMPGHTPGHFIYLLKGKDHDVIFTGDAAKNRAELLSGKADGTYDQAVSSKSIAAIWTLWKARPGNVVIPGHDIPMVLKEGRPEYLAKREAAMKAWFGDDLDTTTTIELAVR